MAIIVALTAVPMLALIGAAIDFNQVMAAKRHLQMTADATALAVARMPPNATDEEIDTLAQQFFDRNFTPNTHGLTVTVDADVDGVDVTVDASSVFKPNFMKVLGFHEMPLEVHAAASKGVSSLEVAMVLDNTGSMSGWKLDAMKEAATMLVDYLQENALDEQNVRVSLVPFSRTVNVRSQDLDWSGDGDDYTGSGWSMVDVDQEAQFHGALFDATVKNTEGRVQCTSERRDDGDCELVDETYVTNHLALFEQVDLSWRGCVEARPSPLDELDVAPGSTAGLPGGVTVEDTRFVPYFWPDQHSSGNGRYNYLSDRDQAGTYLSNHPSMSSVDKWRHPGKYYRDNMPELSTGPNYGCVGRPITPLTSNVNTLHDDIDDMSASGNTNIPMGLTWGWRTLSPGEPFTGGLPYDDPINRKALILLTDGVNTIGSQSLSAYGFAYEGRLGATDDDEMEDEMDDKLLRICENVKDAGIQIHTVAFDMSDPDLIAMFKTCASNPAYFYQPLTEQDLVDAFGKIAAALAQLRIVN